MRTAVHVQHPQVQATPNESISCQPTAQSHMTRSSRGQSHQTSTGADRFLSLRLMKAKCLGSCCYAIDSDYRKGKIFQTSKQLYSETHAHSQDQKHRQPPVTKHFDELKQVTSSQIQTNPKFKYILKR